MVALQDFTYWATRELGEEETRYETAIETMIVVVSWGRLRSGWRVLEQPKSYEMKQGLPPWKFTEGCVLWAFPLRDSSLNWTPTWKVRIVGRRKLKPSTFSDQAILFIGWRKAAHVVVATSLERWDSCAHSLCKECLRLGPSFFLYRINSLSFYLFEKQPNAYIPRSMMACVCLAPMLGNTGLHTRLQPGEWQTGVATTQS